MCSKKRQYCCYIHQYIFLQILLFKNLYNGFFQYALIILFYVVLLKVCDFIHHFLVLTQFWLKANRISLNLDKSGFLSGLVNHAVSAAMRTIMKVLRQKMNQIQHEIVNRLIPKFHASDFIVSLNFKLLLGFNSPTKFIGFSLLSILVTFILPLGMANVCDVIFPSDCKVCTLSFRNITFSLLNWNINFNRYTFNIFGKICLF